MESLPVSMMLFGLILVVGIQTSFAIKCHVCNSGVSYDGNRCADPLETDDFLVDCDKESARRNMNFTICAKIKQDVEGEQRTIRQCGTKMPEGRSDRCVERTGTKKIKMTYCNCYDEACNSAPSLLSLKVLLLTIVSALLAFIAQS